MPSDNKRPDKEKKPKTFDEALDQEFGKGFAKMYHEVENCKWCKSKMITCPCCGEVICSEGCREEDGR